LENNSYIIRYSVFAITATIAGSESWQEIKYFGADNLKWLQKFTPLKGRIQSHHTIARVFSAINPAEFRKVFAKWLNDCQTMTHGPIIAIDGKCLKGSYSQEDKKDAIYTHVTIEMQNQQERIGINQTALET
jgi:hypothetical protein